MKNNCLALKVAQIILALLLIGVILNLLGICMSSSLLKTISRWVFWGSICCPVAFILGAMVIHFSMIRMNNRKKAKENDPESVRK